MRTNPPQTITVLASVIAAGLGVLLHENLISIAALEPHDFWLVVGGFVLLFLGVVLRGL